jgi:excisionase family DNA binding protein
MKGRDVARSAAQVLHSVQPSSDAVDIRVANRSTVLPTPGFHGLLEILELLSHGSGVRIVPIDDELSTEEASRVLGVSRPHLVKMLEKGELPFTKVGSRRRIRAADLALYIEVRDRRRRAGRAEFDKLAARLRSYLR